LGITNSYFHDNEKKKFNTVRRIRDLSKEKLGITLSHSTFLTPDNFYNCVSDEKGLFFLAPSTWDNFPVSDNNVVFYSGHYMTMYHYHNKPVKKELNNILYLPVSGISDIKQVLRTLENLMNHKIFIKVHPTTEKIIRGGKSSAPDKWPRESIGIPIDDYIKLAHEYDNIEILYDSKSSLIDAIDSCRYIIGSPPTSTLIESSIRGTIYGDGKLIVSNDFNSTCEYHGIPFCQKPSIKDFKLMDRRSLSSFVIGEEKQIESLLTGIEKCIAINRK